MKLDISRYAPPGFDLTAEKRFFTFGLLASLFASMNFFFKFSNALDLLYWKNGSEKELRPGAIMPDFVAILDKSMVLFLMLALCMPVFIAVHYSYHRQGSKSIYLMRRLPNPMELHRRCLTLPLIASAICLASAFVVLVIYFAVYMNVTPEICLTPDQWQKIWSVIL